MFSDGRRLSWGVDKRIIGGNLPVKLYCLVNWDARALEKHLKEMSYA